MWGYHGRWEFNKSIYDANVKYKEIPVSQNVREEEFTVFTCTWMDVVLYTGCGSRRTSSIIPPPALSHIIECFQLHHQCTTSLWFASPCLFY